MHVCEIAVRMDRTTARDVARFALKEHGFGIQWQSPWSAVADKGTLGHNFVFGALSPHVVLGLVIFETDDLVVIRLERFAAGWYAGPLTAVRVISRFTRLKNALVDAARQENVLVKVTDG